MTDQDKSVLCDIRSKIAKLSQLTDEAEAMWMAGNPEAYVDLMLKAGEIQATCISLVDDGCAFNTGFAGFVARKYPEKIEEWQKRANNE